MHTMSAADVVDELVSFVIAPLLISKAIHSSHSQKGYSRILLGVWVEQSCRMCSGSWTSRCFGRAGMQDVLVILDFQVHG